MSDCDLTNSHSSVDTLIHISGASYCALVVKKGQETKINESAILLCSVHLASRIHISPRRVLISQYSAWDIREWVPGLRGSEGLINIKIPNAVQLCRWCYFWLICRLKQTLPEAFHHSLKCRQITSGKRGPSRQPCSAHFRRETTRALVKGVDTNARP